MITDPIWLPCNRVMHRFIVYAASTVLLFGMWTVFLPGIVR